MATTEQQLMAYGLSIPDIFNLRPYVVDYQPVDGGQGVYYTATMSDGSRQMLAIPQYDDLTSVLTPKFIQDSGWTQGKEYNDGAESGTRMYWTAPEGTPMMPLVQDNWGKASWIDTLGPMLVLGAAGIGAMGGWDSLLGNAVSAAEGGGLLSSGLGGGTTVGLGGSTGVAGLGTGTGIAGLGVSAPTSMFTAAELATAFPGAFPSLGAATTFVNSLAGMNSQMFTPAELVKSFPGAFPSEAEATNFLNTINTPGGSVPGGGNTGGTSLLDSLNNPKTLQTIGQVAGGLIGAGTGSSSGSSTTGSNVGPGGNTFVPPAFQYNPQQQSQQQAYSGPLLFNGGKAQDFGLNPELNKRIAEVTGYQGNFGGGQFQNWLQQNPSQVDEYQQVTSWWNQPGTQQLMGNNAPVATTPLTFGDNSMPYGMNPNLYTGQTQGMGQPISQQPPLPIAADLVSPYPQPYNRRPPVF